MPDSQKTSAMIPLPRHVVNFDWELENETGEHHRDVNVGPVPSQTNSNRDLDADQSCWDEVGCKFAQYACL